MTRVKKIGIILILVGMCLPTVTLPFIEEFHPQPNICLTSNFFGNMGNMIVAFGKKQMNISNSNEATKYDSMIAIPYRHLFALSVILVCTGIGVIVLYNPTSKQ